MTRTELIERVKNARYIRSYNLRKCQATVEEVADEETGEVFYRLRSYKTIVACLLDTQYGRTVFVFDYWSATTCQHISKFIKEYSVQRVCYLYKRSDRDVYQLRSVSPWIIVKYSGYEEEDWESLLNEFCRMGW